MILPGTRYPSPRLIYKYLQIIHNLSRNVVRYTFVAIPKGDICSDRNNPTYRILFPTCVERIHSAKHCSVQ